MPKHTRNWRSRRAETRPDLEVITTGSGPELIPGQERHERIIKMMNLLQTSDPTQDVEQEYARMALSIVDERISRLEAAVCDMELNTELRGRSRDALVKFRALRVSILART
jgi:hypothetical protein